MSRRLTRAELIGLLRGARVTRIPIEEAADMLEADDAYAGALQGALHRVKYELGNYADVIDGHEGKQHPNLAMELETLLLPYIDAALAKNPTMHAAGGQVRGGDSGLTGSAPAGRAPDEHLTVALQDALRNSNAALSLLSAYASDLDRQAINSQLAINYGVLARSPLLVRDVPRTVASQEPKS